MRGNPGELVDGGFRLGQPAKGHKHPRLLVQDGGMVLAGGFHGCQFFQSCLRCSKGKPALGSSDGSLRLVVVLSAPFRHGQEKGQAGL